MLAHGVMEYKSQAGKVLIKLEPNCFVIERYIIHIFYIYYVTRYNTIIPYYFGCVFPQAKTDRWKALANKMQDFLTLFEMERKRM